MNRPPINCPVCGGCLRIDTSVSEERHGQDWSALPWQEWELCCDGPCREQGNWQQFMKTAEEVNAD